MFHNGLGLGWQTSATMKTAIVRPPSRSFARGLTTADMGPPDLEVALRQHAAYCAALERCGVHVIHLDPEPDLPDSTFVEDAAILFGELAVLTRPGAPSRQRETASIKPAIERQFSTVRQIHAPGTLDGGDVCHAGSQVYVGISARTNEAGALQLATLLVRFGLATIVVDIRSSGMLHLKSGLAYLGDGRFVAAESVVHLAALRDLSCLTVGPDESYAANCIRVNDAVFAASGFPNTAEKLEREGYRVLALDVSEFQKMDGGLSCLSLRF